MKISIIIPVYNEEETIRMCVISLINLNYPKKDYEIIVVNDGSSDRTYEKIKDLPIKIINLKKNEGRIIAREQGAKKAKYNNLLFTDSRCIADKDLLNHIKKINYEPLIGNAIQDPNRSFADRFFYLIRKRIYAPYWGENFPSVYINKKNFNRISKGTTIFFCSKERFLRSIPKEKGKEINDDTKLFKQIITEKEILKDSRPKVKYLQRNKLKEAIKHMYERSPRFVDFYLNKKISLLYLLLLLIIIITIVLIGKIDYLLILGIFVLSIISLFFSKNFKDFFIMFIMFPIIGGSFILGITKGVLIKIFKNEN